MSMGAVAVGLGTAAIGASASKSAAKSQANAANAAIANDQATFRQQTQLQEPFRDAGLSANNRLMELLGLDKGYDEATYEQLYNQMRTEASNNHALTYGTTWDSAPSWAKAEIGEYEDRLREKAKQMAKAQYSPGQRSGEFGSLLERFTGEDLENEPGYQFRMNEGMRGVEGGAAARGGLLSGAALKAIQKYGQNFASNEYQNAYARDSADKTNIYNRLAGIVNTGQGATNQISNAAGQMGQSVSNNLIGAGNAQASGQIGAANAIAGGINQGFNTYNQNQLMNLIRQPSSTGWGTGSAYGNQDYGSYF